MSAKSIQKTIFDPNENVRGGVTHDPEKWEESPVYHKSYIYD